MVADQDLCQSLIPSLAASKTGDISVEPVRSRRARSPRRTPWDTTRASISGVGAPTRATCWMPRTLPLLASNTIEQADLSPLPDDDSRASYPAASASSSANPADATVKPRTLREKTPTGRRDSRPPAAFEPATLPEALAADPGMNEKEPLSARCSADPPAAYRPETVERIRKSTMMPPEGPISAGTAGSEGTLLGTTTTPSQGSTSSPTNAASTLSTPMAFRTGEPRTDIPSSLTAPSANPRTWAQKREGRTPPVAEI